MLSGVNRGTIIAQIAIEGGLAEMTQFLTLAGEIGFDKALEHYHDRRLKKKTKAARTSMENGQNHNHHVVGEELNRMAERQARVVIGMESSEAYRRRQREVEQVS